MWCVSKSAVVCSMVYPAGVYESVGPKFGSESGCVQEASYPFFQSSVRSFSESILTRLLWAAHFGDVSVFVGCCAYPWVVEFSAAVEADC